LDAKAQHEQSLRAHYADINERSKARLQERADEAARRSEDRQRSDQQRSDDKALERELKLQIAGMPARSSGNANEMQGDTSKKGDEYLASLPAEDAAIVKKIASGEIPLTSFSTRGGHREMLAKMASLYDPAFNVTRSAVWRDFTSGPTGKNITSINTAIAHMGTMSDLADALKNNDVQAANKLVNFLSQQTGNPAVTNFETARQAVGEELMRTFRVVGASEHEAQAWMDRFKVAASPQQLRGALSTAGELLGGRIKAVNDQWKRGAQTDKDFPNIIPPENLAEGSVPEYKSEAEASAAEAAGKLDKGTRVKINGVIGTWQ
jgi:hypothetical protein